jgi:hypothetical protein
MSPAHLSIPSSTTHPFRLTTGSQQASIPYSSLSAHQAAHSRHTLQLIPPSLLLNPLDIRKAHYTQNSNSSLSAHQAAHSRHTLQLIPPTHSFRLPKGAVQAYTPAHPSSTYSLLTPSHPLSHNSAFPSVSISALCCKKDLSHHLQASELSRDVSESV